MRRGKGMSAGAGLSRTGFKRREVVRTPQSSLPTGPLRFGRMDRVSDEIVSIPKENAIYSESYRRLVAALPCINCGIEGQSQAAHPPPTGKGIKEDDRETFPLCCTSLLTTGCHVEFDQYRLIPAELMRHQAEIWGAQTRAEIKSEGLWPESLPSWDDSGLLALFKKPAMPDQFGDLVN